MENIMLNINDQASMERALDSPIAPDLKRLLIARCNQLLDDTDHEYDIGDLAQFLVVSPSDAIAVIEAAAGYPIITEPAIEWAVNHGDWYEAVTILSDSGFGIVLLVPNSAGMDPTLIALLRAEAVATIAAAPRPVEAERPHRQ